MWKIPLNLYFFNETFPKGGSKSYPCKSLKSLQLELTYQSPSGKILTKEHPTDIVHNATYLLKIVGS